MEAACFNVIKVQSNDTFLLKRFITREALPNYRKFQMCARLTGGPGCMQIQRFFFFADSQPACLILIHVLSAFRFSPLRYEGQPVPPKCHN